MTDNQREIVITGCSIYTACGDTLSSNIDALWNNKPAFSKIQSYDPADSSVAWAAQCSEPKIIPEKKLRKLISKKDLISVVAAQNAWNDANVDPEYYDIRRRSLFCGVGSNQMGDLYPYFVLVKNSLNEQTSVFDSAHFGKTLLDTANPMIVIRAMLNNTLCYASRILDLRGTNGNYTDFESATMRAMNEAYWSIKENHTDIAVVGGCAASIEAFNIIEDYHMGRLGKTSQLTEPPTTFMKPYDKNRCGAIPSEGSAYIVLEEGSAAKKRGATILAKVLGSSIYSDGNLLNKNQKSLGLEYSISRTFDQCDLNKSDIGFVCGYGNGNKNEDLIELQTYKHTLNKDTPIFSYKSVIGETIEPSSIIGTIFSIDSLRKELIPPTYNYKEAEIGGLAISDKPQSYKSKYALITARSRFGLCGSMVLGV